MTDIEKAQEICEQNKRFHVECSSLECYLSALDMAAWKNKQLGWHDAKKEQPPMDEEVIILTNILNGKELDSPRMICFGHIVDKNICVDYDGWNIPGVEYWMQYNEPTNTSIAQ